MVNRQRGVRVVVFVSCLAAAHGAGAQDGVFGIGPRVTFEKAADNLPDTPSLRFVGGQVKLRMSPRTAVELAVDYKSTTSTGLTEKVKSLPIQASLLLYLVRAGLSPYVLGGVGWHSTTSAPLGPIIGDSTAKWDTGYHAGVGAELRAGRYLAFHLDYRYTRVRFGKSDPDAPSTPGALPLPGTRALQNALRLAHQGSMTNMGLTLFF